MNVTPCSVSKLVIQKVTAQPHPRTPLCMRFPKWFPGAGEGVCDSAAKWQAPLK